MFKEVLALGLAQTIAWAASTYLIAIVARPIAFDLGIATSTVFGAFSVSLVVMALVGPVAGRAIDRWGGRGVLVVSNFVFAAGLLMLGASTSLETLFGAWCVIGVGMALGLYEAAFATLVRLHGAEARRPITGITLIAGFASTVGWPLSAFLLEHYGWRTTCGAWAAIQILIALPLNLYFIPRAVPNAAAVASDTQSTEAQPALPRAEYRRAFLLLVIFGAMTSFVTSAMAAHLPGLLVAAGSTTAAALIASALLGPAQVAARLSEFLAAQRFRFHPLVTARIATACHPIAGIFLVILGGPAAVAMFFSVVHGAGNGMITIAKGTLPLAIFGAAGYGQRQGLLAMLGRGMQAIAPFAFGVVLERHGPRLAVGLSVLLFFSLPSLRSWDCAPAISTSGVDGPLANSVYSSRSTARRSTANIRGGRMNKALFGALVVSTFGLSALPALSADLTIDERTELRARADRLAIERAQRPTASDVRLDQDRGDMRIRPRGDIKAKPAKVKKPKHAKRSSVRKTSLKESVKKVPGALVRR